MKPTLLLVTMSMILATPAAFGRSELSDLEKLRLRCQEQERQIHLLEEENSQLRGEMEAPSRNSPGGGLQLISTSTKPVTASSGGSASYTVKSGDSFSSIARAKGTTAETLAKTNGLKLNAVIRPGQVLKVPAPAAAREAAKTAPAAPAAAPAAGRDLPSTHKIVQGETFSSIARKYKIGVTALVAANPQAKPTALRPGQIVNIPGGTPEKSIAKAPAKSAPASKTAETPPAKSRPETPPSVAKSDKPAPPEKPAAASEPIPKVHPITIDNEMTYGEFAAKYGTDTKRLNALNGLDLTTATVLAKGSELYVPANP